jgi:hypothetical protein
MTLYRARGEGFFLIVNILNLTEMGNLVKEYKRSYSEWKHSSKCEDDGLHRFFQLLKTLRLITLRVL